MSQDALRHTPLDECHREAGARMVEFVGWSMPVQYAGVLDEHRAVRRHAGLFDVSHMGEIRVAGAGAEAFLQRLTPNDVERLAPGRAHYSGLLNERGGYIDDLLIYRLAADEFLVVVNAANAETDFEWIRGHATGGVTVEDVSADYALLALQGPRALGILASLTDVTLNEIGYYRFTRGRVADHDAILSRTGYTGEDGFELYVEPGDAPAIWRRLLAAGEAEGLVPAGLGARDTLRLEAGMALYGHELDAETTPWEAGLDWVVKLDSGDFIGRRALLEQKEAGVPQRLVGFEVEGRGIAREGHPVLVAGGPAGRVTSGTFSPTFERALGMAYLPAELAAPERQVEIEVRGRHLPAQLIALPFYRRER